MFLQTSLVNEETQYQFDGVTDTSSFGSSSPVTEVSSLQTGSIPEKKQNWLLWLLAAAALYLVSKLFSNDKNTKKWTSSKKTGW